MRSKSTSSTSTTTTDTNPIATPDPARAAMAGMTLAQLVGQVYEGAPVAERSRLLAQLMKPLGVLSLMAVANGVFAKLRFSAGWPDLQGRLDDLQQVQASDVTSLASRVEQVSLQALDGLTQVLSTSPALASSTTAALLLTVLMQRAHQRACAQDDEDSFGLGC